MVVVEVVLVICGVLSRGSARHGATPLHKTEVPQQEPIVCETQHGADSAALTKPACLIAHWRSPLTMTTSTWKSDGATAIIPGVTWRCAMDARERLFSAEA